MTAIQIFGVPISISYRRALIAFKELKVPYELRTVDITKGEQKSAETLAHQPFGQIPYIFDPNAKTDTGATTTLSLFESRAIARYIVKKYDVGNKTGLIPKGEIENAKFEQAASIEVTRFDPPAFALATELIFKPVLQKVPGNPQVVEENLERLNSVLDLYDVILSKQKYLSGDNVTLADLFHLSLGTLLTDMAKLDVMTTDKRPNVQRWWKDLYTRPVWTEIKADLAPLA